MFKAAVIGLVAAAAVVVLTACGSGAATPPQREAPLTSVVSYDEASTLLQQALDAFNTGDYDAWSQTWSDAMKSMIKQADFMAFRSEQMKRLGRFESISRVELVHGQSEGYVRWVAVAKFEKGEARLGLAFRGDGREAEGAFFQVIR